MAMKPDLHIQQKNSATGPVRSILMVAGEASGDLLGGELIEEFRGLPGSDAWSFVGVGGQTMRQAGLSCLVPMEQLSVLGLWDVLKQYRRIRKIFWDLVRQAEQIRPDTVVLIDYPGFNLRFAHQMKKRGIRVVYYVSPQLWAWGKHRLKKMPHLVDLMLTLFPFEEELYHGIGVKAYNVGHPVVDRLSGLLESPIPADLEGLSGQRIALLPGSRTHEIKRILPVMLGVGGKLLKEAASRTGGDTTTFLIGVAEEGRESMVRELLDQHAGSELISRCRVEVSRARDYMRAADWGMVASGTATLEAACLGMPMLVLYKVDAPTYLIAKRLVNVPHLSMVNILAGREVVPEYIQDRCCPEIIFPGALTLASEGPGCARDIQTRELGMVAKALGPPGGALRAAQALLSFLNKG